MAGPSAADVMRQYTALTGRMPLPPLWALGFHQSRWGYKSADEFRRLAHEFRSRNLPCDVLYFDIDYMDGYRVFTWDRAQFPDLPGLVQELEAQGFKCVAIVDPGIKVDADYDVYQSGVRDDVFLKMPDGKRIAAPVWPGVSLPRFYTPQRARLVGGACAPVAGIGALCGVVERYERACGDHAQTRRHIARCRSA